MNTAILGLCLMTGMVSLPKESNDFVTLNTVPRGLEAFWAPICTILQKNLPGAPESSQRSLGEIGNYCQEYARQNPDPNKVTLMIVDLCHHPSETRAIFYGEVVVNWNKKETLSLLWWYADHGNAAEKTAANDFIADMEEYYSADFSTHHYWP